MKIKKIIIYSKDALLNTMLNLTSWIPDNPITCRFRGYIVKLFVKAGKGLEIGARVKFLYTAGITLGNYVYIAGGCWVSGRGGLVIEDEVVIGPYSIIVTSNHTFVNGSARFAPATYAPVLIGKGSWLASHVVITSGTKIGKGNLIAANSVVTKDTSDDVIIGGIPGKVIGVNK